MSDLEGWVYAACNLHGHPSEAHWHPPVGDTPAALSGSTARKPITLADSEEGSYDDASDWFGSTAPLDREPPPDAGIDAAWAAATQALPEGWALWGIRFRAPNPKRSRPRGQYEAWAGPIPPEGEPVAWPRPLRGLSGYSSDTPAAALGALAARLAASPDPAQGGGSGG